MTYRDSTCVTPLRSMRKRFTVQFPELMACSSPLESVSCRMHLRMSNCVARLDLDNTAVYGLTYIARHVICRTLNPHILIWIYDVTSIICQAQRLPCTPTYSSTSVFLLDGIL